MQCTNEGRMFNNLGDICTFTRNAFRDFCMKLLSQTITSQNINQPTSQRASIDPVHEWKKGY